MRTIKCLVVVLVLSGSVHAGSYDGGTSTPFSMGAGARELALGGACLATADPTTAPFWNPSRLARADRLSFTGFHVSLFDSDASYQYAGVAFPTLDYGTVGLGVFRLGVNDITVRDASNIELGTTEEDRLGILLSYGRTISSYDIGFSLSLEHQSLDTYHATSSPGLSLSIGREFEPPFDWLGDVSVVGIARNVVSPELKLSDQTMSIPLEFSFGIATSILPERHFLQSIVLSAAINKIDYVSPSMRFGLECNTGQHLRFRAGWQNDRPSYGAGLEMGFLDFDYALVDRQLGSLHMFTVTSFLGSTVDERRRLRAERRDAGFDQLMADRFNERNREMVVRLIADGQHYLDLDSLDQASSSIQRAEFLARTIQMDTSAINRLAAVASARLEQRDRNVRYSTYLDSAQVAFDAMNHLMARHFASLALKEKPEASPALRLRAVSDSVISHDAEKNRTLTDHLREIDSLLAYGRTRQALKVARSIEFLAPDSPDVRSALKRARVEHWKSLADDALSSGNLEIARTYVDSALSLAPGHTWFVQLQDRLLQSYESPEVVSTPARPTMTKPLSEQLRRTVQAKYRAAQNAFETGALIEAIEGWEEVEALAPDYELVRKYLANGYLFIGIEYYGQNRLSDAVEVWKKAAGLDPGNAEISGYIKRTQSEILRLRELSYEQ